MLQITYGAYFTGNKTKNLVPWHYRYEGPNNGGKCVKHTVTESVLTNVIRKPTPQ